METLGKNTNELLLEEGLCKLYRVVSAPSRYAESNTFSFLTHYSGSAYPRQTRYSYHYSPLGNCQIGSISGFSALLRLKQEGTKEAGVVDLVIEFLLKAAESNKFGIKNELLIDVYETYRETALKLFKDVGGVIVYVTDYVNKTGNKMSSILIDLVPAKIVDTDGSRVSIDILMEDYDYEYEEAEDFFETMYKRNEDTELLEKKW